MIVTCVAVLGVLLAAAPQAPIRTSPDYAGLVQQYRSGNPDVAIEGVSGLGVEELREGLRAFLKFNLSPELLGAAAAMHAEAGLRPRSFTTLSDTMRHLSIATGLVELGTTVKRPRLGAAGLQSKASVTPPLRRLVLLAAIASLQYSGRTPRAAEYLETTRLLFPHDAAVLLFSGISEESRASGRLAPASDATRRTSLASAEVYLRESRELKPDEIETTLRLGRVLAQRQQVDEARALLTGVVGAADTRLSYLGSLFLGGLEDAAGKTEDAAGWYAKAAARMPSAQAARLAGSELRHRAGARRDAAVEADAAVGAGNADDPWWRYFFGEPDWTGLYLDALREMSRS